MMKEEICPAARRLERARYPIRSDEVHEFSDFLYTNVFLILR